RIQTTLYSYRKKIFCEAALFSASDSVKQLWSFQDKNLECRDQEKPGGRRATERNFRDFSDWEYI
ncbi:MAG: hypothetical protein IJ109_06430, partial [Firmicutes bacterium]|nr:hypothetical protein [Bacillota bacterium]